MRYLEMILVALDCAVNVLLLGSWQETLSSRAWRMDSEGKPWGKFWRPVIDALFFWQPGHCHAQWLRESAAGGVWKSFNSPSA
jgi:hypothetical protein